MSIDVPIVKIEVLHLDKSEYKRDKQVWYAQTLIDYCKAKEYKTFDLPLSAVNLSVLMFAVENIADFIFQVRRVENTDLRYPIILDDLGQIADGWHRVCKAILNGDKTIKAVRMESMPAYDKWEDEEE